MNKVTLKLLSVLALLCDGSNGFPAKVAARESRKFLLFVSPINLHKVQKPAQQCYRLGFCASFGFLGYEKFLGCEIRCETFRFLLSFNLKLILVHFTSTNGDSDKHAQKLISHYFHLPNEIDDRAQTFFCFLSTNDNLMTIFCCDSGRISTCSIIFGLGICADRSFAT